jgi:osmotically-inducible protein OsmY
VKTPARILMAAFASAAVLAAGGCQKPIEAVIVPAPAVALSTEVTDMAVTERVKLALLNDPSLKAFDIVVVTTKGDVRLTGTVETQSQIDHADAVVRAVDGVHSIHGELLLKK